jgi:hypothetical protein
MANDKEIIGFLSSYDEKVVSDALLLRKLLFDHLPDIQEQIDLPAKMIGYCYGQKYAELICMLIPSKKGLKLSFNRGSSLPDPDKLLHGTGKISRYVEIEGEKDINSPQLENLLAAALEAYRTRK